MNCEKESENKEPGKVDSAPGIGNGDESFGEQELPETRRFRDVPSSSGLSIQSEAVTSANGDNLLSTDSECCALSIGNCCPKTARQKSLKRKAKSLTPGCAKDWESNDSWTSEKAQEDCAVAAEEIETKRKKIKSLQQKNRRLRVRHSRLKAAIKEMKASMVNKE